MRRAAADQLAQRAQVQDGGAGHGHVGPRPHAPRLLLRASRARARASRLREPRALCASGSASPPCGYVFACVTAHSGAPPSSS